MLWPDHRVSFAAVSDSPVLQDMVFTGPASTVYTHTTHRLFPLKTSSQTGAELTEISSMVSGEERDRASPSSTTLDSRSTSLSNSPYTSGSAVAELALRNKIGHGGTLQNGLTATEYSLQMNSTTLLPPPSLLTYSSPSTQDDTSPPSSCKPSPSPCKHSSSLKIHTGILTRDNDFEGSSKCNGEITDNPFDHSTNKLADVVRQRERSAGSSGECRELLCVPTHMPLFLLAYAPPVSLPMYVAIP